MSLFITHQLVVFCFCNKTFRWGFVNHRFNVNTRVGGYTVLLDGFLLKVDETEGRIRGSMSLGSCCVFFFWLILWSSSSLVFL